MLKKTLIIATTVILLCLAFTTTVMASDEVSIDRTQLSKGIVGVKYTGGFSQSVKVIVKLNADNSEMYTIRDNKTNWFSLTYGKGEYTVTIVKQISSDKGRVLAAEKVTLGDVADSVIYSNSIQNVNFNSEMEAIKGFSKTLTGITDQKEKLDAIYNYIITNVKYDNNKRDDVVAKKIIPPYIPVIDNTYNSNLGICYDYSSLFAAALRYNGIPTKLQFGFCSEINVLHAWNEVLLDGKWFKIDTTYDAAAKAANVAFTQAKDNSKYTVQDNY